MPLLLRTIHVLFNKPTIINMKKILLSLCFLFAGAAAYAGCGPNGGPCGGAEGHSHDKAVAVKSCCGEDGKCCKGEKSCSKEAKSCSKEAKSCCGKCGGDKKCSKSSCDKDAKSCCGKDGKCCKDKNGCATKSCDKAKSCCGKCGGDKMCSKSSCDKDAKSCGDKKDCGK